MRRNIVGLLALLFCIVVTPVTQAGVESLVAPRAYETNDAGGGSSVLRDRIRLQDIYSSSQFPSNRVLLIRELRYRPSAIWGGAFSTTISNIQINLSTTTVAPEGMSASFATNVGPNDTMVFNGAATVVSAFVGSSTGPKAFDIVFPLQTPFRYDPADGNLLIDIRNFSGSVATIIDSGLNNGGARAWSLDPNSAIAGSVDGGIDVVQLVYSDEVTGGVHDLSVDFSLSGNPSGVWSYGRQDTIGGPLTLLDTAKTNIAGNGVPVLLWAISPFSQPAILHNDTTETATTGGGGNYPPGTTWFAPGPEGQPGTYAVARFTVPDGKSGTYQVVTTVRPAYGDSVQLDTDFHVMMNNLEMFGVNLSASQTAGYTNVLSLVAGDTIDFVVGRGADNSYIWSGLKVEAKLTLQTDVSGLPLVLPSGNENVEGQGGSGLLRDAMRLQDVYGSAFFPSGQLLTIREIRLRPSIRGGAAFTASISNLQINLSTTQAQPDALNTSFAANVGSNDTVVFSGPISLSSGFVGPAGGPKAFDIVIPLTTPFLYNPTEGNLLVDWRNHSGSSATVVDTAGSLTDAASRAFALNSSSTNATSRDTGAEIIRLIYTVHATLPEIVSGPTNQTVIEGTNVVFSVEATGTAPLRYTWWHGMSALSDSTNSTLVLTNVQLSQAGDYRVVVSNAFGVATSQVATLAVNPVPLEPDFDLSRDFSVSSNPNGVWSYGRQDTIGGAFTLLGTAKTNFANGVPIVLWAISSSSQPAIQHNSSGRTASGTAWTFPPGETWFGPGVQGNPGNYAAARFTVPAGGEGNYQVLATAQPSYDVSVQRDTDFHIARNNVEIFGAQLNGGQTAGFTNTLALRAGDTIDFAVGRGADDSYIWSGLKVEAALTRLWSKLQPTFTNASSFELSFDARQGDFRIEASTNLINWTTLTNTAGLTGRLSIFDPDATFLPRRFYRVLLLQ